MARVSFILASAFILVSGASAGRPLFDLISGAVAEVEGAVGRGLRQVTDSYTTQGGNQYRNPVQIYAHAREAEAWSHARAIGIYQNQGAQVTAAGDTYPSGRSQALSQGGQDRGARVRSTGGFPPANVLSLFGPTAIATTELGFRAMSAVNAIPMIRSNNDNTGNPFRTSSASTTSRWETVEPRQGSGRERLVFTDSLGYTERGPLSNGISESGGGPTAADTNDNDRFGFGNRR
ncbi:hypothetical protein MNEG_3198 [Monoraphidium neglectum]|uniref:SCP domain-containing protein n=1 Tax=Monoraphidium neglectum TaxID=145388 RepID=A0A0D2MQ19_9CHLO|nr:hypothetical protein MNEG_3198 [Monoraphidium neglectum]KIZ04755.1 hypothetical protein MNEG_3198 [Monoraphidium neglectum]|eukprot:XP_013903774.1 hypothetical protein MNEG_3198 [Monoraphidium neglectum]